MTQLQEKIVNYEINISGLRVNEGGAISAKKGDVNTDIKINSATNVLFRGFRKRVLQSKEDLLQPKKMLKEKHVFKDVSRIDVEPVAPKDDNSRKRNQSGRILRPKATFSCSFCWANGQWLGVCLLLL